jgi:hypothetical protein
VAAIAIASSRPYDFVVVVAFQLHTISVAKGRPKYDDASDRDQYPRGGHDILIDWCHIAAATIAARNVLQAFVVSINRQVITRSGWMTHPVARDVE